ncbi:MAG TPA: hypothetical protein VFM38_12900, partial [Candidatus Limnocylindrales bacterium]|nr:hypothetical protein [Candidatus Limnocylindrales bacterium]
RKLELDDGTNLMVTVHPSFLLRMPDRDRAGEARQRFEDSGSDFFLSFPASLSGTTMYSHFCIRQS